jgi:hypothetical protein
MDTEENAMNGTEGKPEHHLNEQQRDLLASFANGPRIWDAAALFKIVCELDQAGYVKFIGDGPKAEITDAGRAALGRS